MLLVFWLYSNKRVLIFQCWRVQEGPGQILRWVWEGEGEKQLTFILLFILNVYISVLYQAWMETDSIKVLSSSLPLFLVFKKI